MTIFTILLYTQQKSSTSKSPISQNFSYKAKKYINVYHVKQVDGFFILIPNLKKSVDK